MRLKRNRLTLCHHRKAVAKKDDEGNAYVEYGPPRQVEAEVWAGGGKLQTEMYGQRLNYIRNCRIADAYTVEYDCSGKVCYILNDGTSIREGDGICLHTPPCGPPDYKVIAIHPYRFLTLEVEKL